MFFFFIWHLLGFLIRVRVLFKLSWLFLTSTDSHKTIFDFWFGLYALYLVETKFLYSSFGVNLSHIYIYIYIYISEKVSNLFLETIINLLLIYLSSSEDTLYCVVLTVCLLFLRRLRRIVNGTILWSEDTPSKEEYASHFRTLLVHFYDYII